MGGRFRVQSTPTGVRLPQRLTSIPSPVFTKAGLFF